MLSHVTILYAKPLGTIKINYHIKNIPQRTLISKKKTNAIKSKMAVLASSSLNIFTKSIADISNVMLKGM